MECIGCSIRVGAAPRRAVLFVVLTLLGLSGCQKPREAQREVQRAQEVKTEPERPVSAPAPAAQLAPKAEPATSAPAAAAESPMDNERGFGVVIATRLNVREKAGTGHRVLDTLRCGDIVDIRDKDGAWYSVAVQGLAGYAHSSYVFRVGPGGARPICRRPAPGPGGRRVSEEPAAPIRLQAERSRDPAPTGPKVPSAPDGNLPIEEPARLAAAEQKTKTAEVKTEPGHADGGTPEPRDAGVAAKAAAPARALDRGPASVLFAQDSTKVAPSGFPHQLHQARLACSKCHHPVSAAGAPLQKLADGEANHNKRCRSCHKSGDQAAGAVGVALEDAMHRTCRDCHTALGPERAPRAPRKCAECHRG